MKEHWFWWLVVVAVVVWYSTVALYVAVRGTLDIRHMLRRLSNTSSTMTEKRGLNEPS